MSDLGYRKVIYRWLHRQSQNWLHGPSQIESYITAERSSQLDFEKERWQRIFTMQKERGITPLKRESWIKWADEKKEQDRIQVSLLIVTRQAYDIQGKWHEEEIEEWVELELKQTSSGWQVHMIETDPIAYNGKTNQLISLSYQQFEPPSSREFEEEEPYLEPIEQPEEEYEEEPVEEPTPPKVEPPVKPPDRAVFYNRAKAVQYAEAYWNSYNPSYRHFTTDDCTNFISQCVHAGGIPMEFANRPSNGWWYRQAGGGRDTWSYSWAVAHSFYWYLRGKRTKGLRTELVDSPYKLYLGDVICYDWEGDGRWNHNVIVTAFDANGAPLVNAHTNNSRHRYWEYKDSPAWTPKVKYAFFHIIS